MPVNKRRFDADDDDDPSEEYRTRFIYCSIGATLMCIGVTLLISGITVYIVYATGPNHYLNSMLHHHQHGLLIDTYWPIIISIILSSSGIAFITIAIVFTLMACFTNGRVQERFNRRYSPNRTNHHRNHQRQHYSPPEEQRLIATTPPVVIAPPVSPVVIPSNNNNNNAIQSPPPPPPPPPPVEPVIINNNNLKPEPETIPATTKGDINTVGLPLATTTTTTTTASDHTDNYRQKYHHHHHSTKKVPPNGFSYLARPEEIEIYHEYHRTSKTRDPVIRRETVRTSSHESVI